MTDLKLAFFNLVDKHPIYLVAKDPRTENRSTLEIEDVKYIEGTHELNIDKIEGETYEEKLNKFLYLANKFHLKGPIMIKYKQTPELLMVDCPEIELHKTVYNEQEITNDILPRPRQTIPVQHVRPPKPNKKWSRRYK